MPVVEILRVSGDYYFAMLERKRLRFSDVSSLQIKCGLIVAADEFLVHGGVLGWMPEIKGFFEVVQILLKPGGKLVMEEMHPVLFMYEENPESGASSIQYSYFDKKIWEETSGLDYYSGEEYDSRPNYSFMHRLDEILMAGIGSGLSLLSFKELDYDISLFCADLEQSPTKPPLGFVMVMENIVMIQVEPRIPGKGQALKAQT